MPPRDREQVGRAPWLPAHGWPGQLHRRTLFPSRAEDRPRYQRRVSSQPLVVAGPAASGFDGSPSRYANCSWVRRGDRPSDRQLREPDRFVVVVRATRRKLRGSSPKRSATTLTMLAGRGSFRVGDRRGTGTAVVFARTSMRGPPGPAGRRSGGTRLRSAASSPTRSRRPTRRGRGKAVRAGVLGRVASGIRRHALDPPAPSGRLGRRGHRCRDHDTGSSRRSWSCHAAAACRRRQPGRPTSLQQVPVGHDRAGRRVDGVRTRGPRSNHLSRVRRDPTTEPASGPPDPRRALLEARPGRRGTRSGRDRWGEHLTAGIPTCSGSPTDTGLHLGEGQVLRVTGLRNRAVRSTTSRRACSRSASSGPMASRPTTMSTSLQVERFPGTGSRSDTRPGSWRRRARWPGGAG